VSLCTLKVSLCTLKSFCAPETQIGGLVERAPFKFTTEYIELLDGAGSPVYEQFCRGCVAAMQAARAHGETICTLVEVAGTRSTYPCFLQTPVTKVLPKLRKRLLMHKTDAEVEGEVMRLIRVAHDHPGTRYYDKAQKMQRGIAA